LDPVRTIQEIILKAHEQMPANLWDHVRGGAESETTLCRNRQALDSLAFRPRVLRDVSAVDPSSTFLGQALRIPVLLAPIGQMDQFADEAAWCSMRAASEFGVFNCLSSINFLTLEDAAVLDSKRLLFQLYLQGGATWLDEYLDRVAQAKPAAFCLTVDTALYSRRERDMINRFAPPGRGQGERDGFENQAHMSWELVAKLRDRLDIPIILKGIATAADAKRAVDHGVDVVYVSNHGGRQLDHGRGSLDALTEVVDAVAGQADVLVDGGIVRGSDILKALALGARAVGLGKLQVWALAAAGQEGLTRMLEILEEELRVCMGLCGITRLDQVDPSYIEAVQPANTPTAFSQFPSLVGRLG
jgi:isopentenyl diphosphate isomerase/L-lactate dehydrogenase-like FMN-dependent dehydrogenase